MSEQGCPRERIYKLPCKYAESLRARVAELEAGVREVEFCLSAAVIPDGHERCRMALEKLRAVLAKGREA